MLNKQKGNMYKFIDATWNTIKGKCYHDCSYCYMKRWGKQSEIHFDEKELKTDLGENNFIFVGSSCDMFADENMIEWVTKTLNHCGKHNNKYLYQTKNPKNFNYCEFKKDSILCATVESNRDYPVIMGNAPCINNRIKYFKNTIHNNKMITIEPILDFDLKEFVDMLKFINPFQINIGADSGGHNLPEPQKEKVLELIQELEKFTKVYLKQNLNRIIK